MDKKLIAVIKDMLETATFSSSGIELCMYAGEFDGEDILDIFTKVIARLKTKEEG